MRKRLLALVLSGCLLCLSACSPAATVTTTTIANTTAAQTTTTPTTTRKVTKGVKTTPATRKPSTTVTAAPTTTATTTTQPTTTTATIDYESLPFTPVYSTSEYFEARDFYDDVTEQTVKYLFHEPLRDSGEPMPLVIFLHGKGDSVTLGSPGTATPMVRSMMELENESYHYGAYTLVPSTPLAHEGQWTDFQVLAFKMLLADLIERYNIDESRIYLSGVSMGGFMTCQLVNEMPGTFAAAVPLSGAQNVRVPLTSHVTAFRIYHVATDPVVDVSRSRSLYQQLVESGHPNVEYIEYPDGSHISPIYTVFEHNRDAFFDWLFSQRLPQ